MVVNRAAIHEFIDDHLDEHVEHVRQWVRQPSVSWDNLGVEECARLVAESYSDLGCSEVEIIDGQFHPGVWAYYDAGAPVTLHNYCMFDTRPASREGWDYDPWGAEVVPMEHYPKVLVGRGAISAKGPYVAFLNALRAIIAVEGTLPVNIAFLAEGEEIMGSPAYNQFVERYRDRLSNVSAGYYPTSTQSPDGVVNVGLGLKGMVVLELIASGESWGYGPRSTVHSSAAPLLDSPPFRLANALASMTDDEGRGCTVPGLEELQPYRKPLTQEECELLDGLAERFAGYDWRDVLSVGGAANAEQLIGETDGMKPLLNYLYGPSFNIAGLRSGFLGAETATIPFIVPHQATATLDMRMVVDISPEEIIGHIRRYLDDQGFGDIEVNVYSAFHHHQTSPSEPIASAAQQTLSDKGIDAAVWPIEAGGGPWTSVPNTFGVPCLRGGVVGGGATGTNEYLVIEGDGRRAGLVEAEKHHVDLLYHVAHALGGKT